ncbi:hypothetical protein [Rhodopirellula baltica]
MASSRCFGTKRGGSASVLEFAEIRPITSPGGT